MRPEWLGKDHGAQSVASVLRSDRRGGDADIGPKLPGLLRDAGVGDVRIEVAQPVAMAGPGKLIGCFTLQLIGDAIVSEGLATSNEIDALLGELWAFTEEPTTIMSQPRVVQAYGRLL